MADTRIDGPRSSAAHLTSEAEGAVPTPKPGPTSSVEQNRVEEAERAYARATVSPGEDLVASRARALGPHQSVEVSCKALVSGELAGKVEGKLVIEHRDDGKYEVTAFGAAQAGAGADLKLIGGVAAGTKFVVNTPEAAADIAQAVATLGVTTSAKTNLGLYPWASLADKISGTSDHALERLDHYRENLVKVSADARLTGSIGIGVHTPGLDLHAIAEGQIARGVAVDFERGEIAVTSKLEIVGEGRATLGLGHSAGGKTAGLNVFDAETEGKYSVKLEERKQVPPQLLEKLKRGELDPAAAYQALSRAPSEWTAIAEIEIEKSLTGMVSNGVGRAKLVTEIPLGNGAEFAQRMARGDVRALAEPFIKAEWEVEGEIGVGPRFAAGSASLGAEAGALTFMKYKSDKGSLEHCLAHANASVDEQVDLQRQLEAYR